MIINTTLSTGGGACSERFLQDQNLTFIQINLKDTRAIILKESDGILVLCRTVCQDQQPHAVFLDRNRQCAREKELLCLDTGGDFGFTLKVTTRAGEQPLLSGSPQGHSPRPGSRPRRSGGDHVCAGESVRRLNKKVYSVENIH